MTETWKPVVGYETRYEVSDFGRVRSLLRGNALLKLSPAGAGHLRVKLYDNKNPYIHRLVLEAFQGPAPVGMVGCHKDDNPRNNCLANLEWGTQQHNIQTSYALGRRKSPRKHEGCDVKGCDEPHSARGLCGRHYAAAKYRGELPVRHSRETCAHGHPRTAENTYTSPRGVTYCKPCQSARHAKWQRAKRIERGLTAMPPTSANV